MWAVGEEGETIEGGRDGDRWAYLSMWDKKLSLTPLSIPIFCFCRDAIHNLKIARCLPNTFRISFGNVNGDGLSPKLISRLTLSLVLRCCRACASPEDTAAVRTCWPLGLAGMFQRKKNKGC
jgi:hypothetical protein